MVVHEDGDSRRSTLRRLAIFAAVVERGSMSAAAERIGVGQPAVSSAMLKLEEELGERLLERGPGGVALTREGGVVARRVGRLTDQLESAVRRVSGRDAARAAAITRSLTDAQVRDHRAVVDAGSFRGAATALGVAEPSLQRTVRGLERLVGAPLYRRHPRGFSATPAGVAFARDLGVALREVDQAKDELALASGAARSRIAVGCLPLTPKPLMARALGALIRIWPKVDVAVEEGAYAALRPRLDAGAIDMVVGALRQRPGDDADEQALFVDPYLVVARSDHALDRSSVSSAQLVEALWVAAAVGTPRREALEALFETLPARPGVLLETSSLDMAVAALQESDCLSLLSRSQLRDRTPAFKVLGDAPFAVPRVVGVTMRSNWLPTPVQAAYLHLLKTCSQAYLD